MSDKDKPDILKIIAAANFDKAKKIIKDKLGIEPSKEIIEKLRKKFNNPII